MHIRRIGASESGEILQYWPQNGAQNLTFLRKNLRGQVIFSIKLIFPTYFGLILLQLQQKSWKSSFSKLFRVKPVEIALNVGFT